MSKLLVSVRDAREARMAVDAGVDLIDVKEPYRGSLGAASVETILRIAETVAGKVPLSVALGELADSPEINPSVLAQVSYVKVGLAGCVRSGDWQVRWERLWAELPDSVERVAVVYADDEAAGSPPANAILQAAAAMNCRAILLDTWSKCEGPVTKHWSLERICSFVLAVQKSQMLAVVGGSLAGESLKQVLGLSPDFLAVRGAVCDGDRTGPLSVVRIMELKSQLATFLHGMSGTTAGRLQRWPLPQSVA